MNKDHKLYWTEWFPLENPTSVDTFKIKWSHTQELDKISINRGINNPNLRKIFKLFISSAEHLQLNLGKGKEKEGEKVILFSHGRTGTPFLYTNFFKAFGRERKIYCPQHSEVAKTPYEDLQEIKKYREKEVMERAQ